MFRKFLLYIIVFSFVIPNILANNIDRIDVDSNTSFIDDASIYYQLQNEADKYYKEGNLSESVLLYERALRMDPSNDRIKNNLEAINYQTIDKLSFKSSWIENIADRLAYMFSSSTWIIIAIIFFVLSIICFIIFKISLEYKTKKYNFWSFLVFLFFSIWANFMLMHQYYYYMDSFNYAVVSEQKVTIQGESESREIHSGTKVRILDENRNSSFINIELADGFRAKIPLNSIKMI